MNTRCLTALTLALLLTGLAASPSFAAGPAPADYDVPSGHFYTQANGGAQDGSGYGVGDAAGIPMWSEFQRLGGVAALGYPVSGRFQAGGFVEQAFQKAVLQWRPDQRQAQSVNIMDLLHDAGADPALEAAHQIPPAAANLGDAPARLSLLDFPNSAFKDAYNAAPDPLATFGLPASRITDEGTSYTLRFQRTAMQLWRVDEPWAKAGTLTIANAGDLAKDNGLVPAAAAQPEPARIVTGQADRTPWSGWWWPSLSGGPGPHLFDDGGPLAKYDAYVRGLGQADPNTRQWELDHFVYDDPKLDWAGKCNGWAVSALVEPEPTKPVTANGITFSVADQKGLLADYYFASPAASLVGSKDTGGVTAADFQRTILSSLGDKHQGLVINAFAGPTQVASFAVYRFQATYLKDPADANKTHVLMTLWAADYHVDPNFVGLKTWPDGGLKTYSYFVYGDPKNPTGGDWEGDSVTGQYAHPENLWAPDVAPADRNKFGQLTSPNLDYAVIQKILTS